MTQPRDAIRFNNSTGSDTAASGLGPATAVTGTAAAHTNGAASTTITLTNSPDLSGVQAGDLLWLKTGSGRQFSVIASVNDGADTVTVDDSFNIASGSAVDYAIGGKRSDPFGTDSQKLFTDWKGEWDVVLEYTGSNYAGSAFAMGGGGSASTGFARLRGDNNGGTVVLDNNNSSNVNTAVSPSTFTSLEDLEIRKSGTGGLVQGVVGNTSGSHVWQFKNVKISQTQSGAKAAGIFSSANPNARITVLACEIEAATVGIFLNDGGLVAPGLIVEGSYIHGCSSHGIQVGRRTGAMIAGNVIAANGGDGIRLLGASEYATIQGNVIHDNTGDGIEFTANTQFPAVVMNNVFTENGGYGINSSVAVESFLVCNDYNAFRNNTSGAVNTGNGLVAGDNDVTLTADPYTDAANDDFTLNNTAGGGAACRDAGFPQTIPGT